MLWLFYISQLIAIQFAISLAKHDAPAVLDFEHHGVTDKDMARFHRYNNWVKFFFCLVIAGVFYPDVLLMFIAGALSALWIYLVFDITLNLNRPGKNWDYVGSNDKDGRRWIKWFGKNAGEWKAVILAALIIIMNVLKLIV